MFVIVGLGNPGKRYENTRHNMGFNVIDKIADEYGVCVDRIKHKALIGEINVSGQKVILVKPQTFMNLSGESVREVMNYYKVPIENLIVIYDDIDIPLGSLRVRKKGSSGTHNGMKNIIYQLKDDSFPRIRVGIGSGKGGDLANFVIGNVNKKESGILLKTCECAKDAGISIITDGIDKAMNKYNQKKEVKCDA